MKSSILADFAAGRALPEQWLGAALVVALVTVVFVRLVRRHVRDTRDESLVRTIVGEREARRASAARLAGGSK